MRKRKSIGYLIVLAFLYAGALLGCGRQDGVFYETAQNADVGSVTDTGADNAGASQAGDLQSDASQAGNLQQGSLAETADGENTQPEEPQTGISQSGTSQAGTSGAESAMPPCYVHICGAVRYPGVYEVPEGSRLYEVIVLAGGLCADACDYLVNQAQAVTDGMQIYIPTVQEAQGVTDGAQGTALPVWEAQGGTAAQNGALGTGFPTGTAAENPDARINLNSATKEQFMTLPGIGETRAEAIIAYREEHGGFAAIEELMEVSGIKQGVYDRLKEMIKV